jgi:hypothetical protein
MGGVHIGQLVAGRPDAEVEIAGDQWNRGWTKRFGARSCYPARQSEKETQNKFHMVVKHLLSIIEVALKTHS